MIKSSKQTSKVIATIIPLFAGIAAIAAVTGALRYLKAPGAADNNKSITAAAPIKSQAKEKDTDIPDYIQETNYTGNLSEYPELYQIPFRKTESYVCNKDFSKDHYEIFEECKNDAAAFLEALFNADYRDIAEDKYAFVTSVMNSADPEAVIIKDYGTEEERTLYLYDYVEELSEYFVDNQVEMDAKFYTDDSLVYSDFYVFVRGELVFTIYSSGDDSLEYDTGTEYKIPVEVAMQRTPSDPSNHAVCSFGRADDNTFFLTP